MTFSESHGLLVHVEIKTPAGKFIDTELTEQLAERKGVKANLLAVSKNIFTNGKKDSKTPLDEIISYGKKCREEAKKFVVGQLMGADVICADSWSLLEERMETCRQKFSQMVTEFVNQFEQIKADVIATQNGVVTEQDVIDRGFGSAEEIAERFVFRVNYMPIPEDNAFDKNLGLKEKFDTAKLDNKINQEKSELAKKAQVKILDTLIECVQNINKQANGNSKLREETIINLQERLIIAKGQNIHNCPEFDKKIKEAIKLCRIDHEASKDETYREEIKKDSDSVLETLMAGYG